MFVEGLVNLPQKLNGSPSTLPAVPPLIPYRRVVTYVHDARVQYAPAYINATCTEGGNVLPANDAYERKELARLFVDDKLGECRTLWGECEQAMHYSIECYVAKALPVKWTIRSQHTGHSCMACS